MALETWEAAARWEMLNRHLGGTLDTAYEMLEKDQTSRLFAHIRETVAGAAGLAHEQKHGLLTPEAIADQPRREQAGREAAMREEIARANSMQLETNTSAERPAGASPACLQGRHEFGSLRGQNGEAECRNCGVVIILPK